MPTATNARIPIPIRKGKDPTAAATTTYFAAAAICSARDAPDAHCAAAAATAVATDADSAIGWIAANPAAPGSVAGLCSWRCCLG